MKSSRRGGARQPKCRSASICSACTRDSSLRDARFRGKPVRARRRRTERADRRSRANSIVRWQAVVVGILRRDDHRRRSWLVCAPACLFRFEALAGVARPHSTITVTDTIPAAIDIPVGGGGNGQWEWRRSGRRGGNGGGAPPPGTIIQTESESSDNVFVGAIRGVLKKPGGRISLDFRLTRRCSMPRRCWLSTVLCAVKLQARADRGDLSQREDSRRGESGLIQCNGR